jgi:hypothetical protein
MQICSGWPCAALHHGRFNADCHEFHGEFQHVVGFCTAAFFRMAIFLSSDQALDATIPGTHDVLHKFRAHGMQPLSEHCVVC